MRDIGTKVDNTPGIAGEYHANDAMTIHDEMKNFIELFEDLSNDQNDNQLANIVKDKLPGGIPKLSVVTNTSTATNVDLFAGPDYVDGNAFIITNLPANTGPLKFKVNNEAAYTQVKKNITGTVSDVIAGEVSPDKAYIARKVGGEYTLFEMVNSTADLGNSSTSGLTNPTSTTVSDTDGNPYQVGDVYTNIKTGERFVVFSNDGTTIVWVSADRHTAFNISRAPSTADNEDKGFKLDDVWADSSTGDEFKYVLDSNDDLRWVRTNSSTAPTAADDNTAGYKVGDVITSGNKTYRCLDANNPALWGIVSSTAPTVNDDTNAGVSVGSIWIDDSSGKRYECLDNSAGTAVWEANSSTVKATVSTSVAPTITENSDAGYINGTTWVDTSDNTTYQLIDAENGIWVKRISPTAPDSTYNSTLGYTYGDDILSGVTQYRCIDPIAAEWAIMNNREPNVTDDSGDGIAIGDKWINYTSGKLYGVVDVTAGAAVWQEVDSVYVYGNVYDKVNAADTFSIEYPVANGAELLDLVHSFEGKIFMGNVVVKLGTGTYNIPTQLFITGQGQSKYQMLELVGNGADSTIIKWTGAATDIMINVIGSYLRLSGLTFDGDRLVDYVLAARDGSEIYQRDGYDINPIKIKGAAIYAISSYYSFLYLNYCEISNSSGGVVAIGGDLTMNDGTIDLVDSPYGNVSYGANITIGTNVYLRDVVITSAITVAKKFNGVASTAATVVATGCMIQGTNCNYGAFCQSGGYLDISDGVIGGAPFLGVYCKSNSFSKAVNTNITFSGKGICCTENSTADAYNCTITGPGTGTDEQVRALEAYFGGIVQAKNSTVSDSVLLGYVSRGAFLWVESVTTSNINNGTDNNKIYCYDGAYVYAPGTSVTGNIAINTLDLFGVIKT